MQFNIQKAYAVESISHVSAVQLRRDLNKLTDMYFKEECKDREYVWGHLTAIVEHFAKQYN